MLRKGKLCEMLALHQHEDPPYLEATRLTVTGRLPPVCMCVFNQLNDFFEEDQAYTENEIVRVCAPGICLCLVPVPICKAWNVYPTT